MDLSLARSQGRGNFILRTLSLSQRAQLCYSIKLHFRDSRGELIKTVEANEGDDILSIAHEHDIDLEGAI
jgi:hypothetical protein